VTPYVFYPEAESEYRRAATYYDRQREGLGDLFVAEIENGINEIRCAPELWPRYEDFYRRYKTDTFPYAIIYEFQAGLITIYAVMHLHRKPGYWKKRRKRLLGEK